MSDDDEDDGPAWAMVMPFVACTSQGGAYDDDGFVAGFVVGGIDAQLRHGLPLEVEYVHPNLLAQLDLLAMRHGYAMTSEPWPDDPDTWVQVTFTVVDHAADLDSGIVP